MYSEKQNAIGVASKGNQKGIVLVVVSTCLIMAGLAAIATLVALELADSASNTDEYYWLHNYGLSNLSLQEYSNGAVASESLICSEIGRDILKSGGNSVDSAIATSVCVGAVQPALCGIGGGSFTLIYIQKEKKVYALDSRESAPFSSNETMFVNKTDASVFGNMAIATPGEVAGYYAIHRKFGKLPWRKLFEPTIKVCLDGYPVPLSLETNLRNVETYIRQFKNTREMYINPATNRTLVAGDIRRDPLYAKTLQRIADDPFDFYNGSLADDIVSDACEPTGTHACLLAKSDLLHYEAKWKTPLSLSLSLSLGTADAGAERTTAYLMPLPSSAAILALFLNVFDILQLSKDDFRTFDSAARFYHRLTEVSKHAFAERTLLGDEGFGRDFSENLRRLLSRDYAALVRSKINDSATFLNLTHYYPPNSEALYVPTDHGTSHISVVDSEGNAVSTTSTINTQLGSMVRGSKTGIQFNNEMDDFSVPDSTNHYGLPASQANYPEAGKRPLSSMAPIITVGEKGERKIVMGAAGGPRILSGTISSLLRMLYLHDDAKQAIDAPRLHHQLSPNYIIYEQSFNQALVEALKKFGHDTERIADYGLTSHVNCIDQRSAGRLQAYADQRSFSAPSGY